MRPLNSKHIETFRAFMQGGTTTAAAKILHMTQPAVSRTLSHLQLSTGLKLFEMHRGRLLPTPEANELFRAVQRHFLGLEKVEETVAALRQTGIGVLRIACTPVLALAVLPAVIQQFKSDHTGVKISLQTVGTSFMRDGLLSGIYDLAISTSDISAKGLEPELLHQTRAVCVMNKQLGLAAKPGVHVRDLKDFPLLVHGADDSLQQMLQQVLAKHGVTPPSVVETNYSATICTLAAAGVGVGIVSSYGAAAFRDVVHVAPFTPGIKVQTHLAYAPNSAPSRLTRDFGDRLGLHLRSQRY
jgi:DNA-binding transcriptional LysR family regulator